MDQMRAKQEDIVKEREKQIALKKGEAARLEDDTKDKGKRKKKSKQVSCFNHWLQLKCNTTKTFWHI